MPSFAETSSSDIPQPGTKRMMHTDLTPTLAKPSPLGTYRLLAPTAGVPVSPLCLGTMNLGTQSGPVMPGPEPMAYLDKYYELGGNFIDVANNCQYTQNQFIIGEWMKARGNRDEIVLASKYSCPTTLRGNDASFAGIGVNYARNHRKNILLSVEASLGRLDTSYLDILYVHAWDGATSIPELMQALNDLVRTGKVLYLGVADTPAWVVSGANEYARAHGMAQFVIYQAHYSLAHRTPETDILPMLRAYNMAFAPCGVLGSGKFKTPDELKSSTRLRGNLPPTESELVASEALMDVARQLGASGEPAVSITGVALAWVRGKAAVGSGGGGASGGAAGNPHVFPVIGGSSIDQLEANVAALRVELSRAQVAALDAACPLPMHSGLFGPQGRGAKVEYVGYP